MTPLKLKLVVCPFLKWNSLGKSFRKDNRKLSDINRSSIRSSLIIPHQTFSEKVNKIYPQNCSCATKKRQNSIRAAYLFFLKLKTRP